MEVRRFRKAKKKPRGKKSLLDRATQNMTVLRQVMMIKLDLILTMLMTKTIWMRVMTKI